MGQRDEPESLREFNPSYGEPRRSTGKFSCPPTALPDFTSYGQLPPGIFDSTLHEVEQRFAWTPHRKELWRNFNRFLVRMGPKKADFLCVYLDGGFVTQKPEPDDLDAILQPKAPWGAPALEAMAPYFQEGLEEIFKKYKVHLHFWCEGFPGGMSDFRLFFQYIRPQDAAPLGLKEDARKGIVRVFL